MIVTTMANGQPQQVIIAGTNQQITLNKGMVIATTASVPTQGQPQQQTIQLQSSQPQQQQQIVRSQPQTTTIQLQAPQQQQPVQSQPQQQQQQQVCHFIFVISRLSRHFLPFPVISCHFLSFPVISCHFLWFICFVNFIFFLFSNSNK